MIVLEYDPTTSWVEWVEYSSKPSGTRKHACGHTVKVSTLTLFKIRHAGDTGCCPGCCVCITCVAGAHVIVDNRKDKKWNSKPTLCPSCTSCPDHCECIRCLKCGRWVNKNPKAAIYKLCKFDEKCTADNNGRHHIKCCMLNVKNLDGHENTVVFVERPLIFFDGKPGATLHSTRYMAMELESLGLDDTTGYKPVNQLLIDWSASAVFDGSLRVLSSAIETPENTTSFEINMSPSSGDAFVKQLHAMCDMLKRYRSRVDSRCGTHLHIDARDLEWKDIQRFVMLYDRVEWALFQMLPQTRRESIFCKPCGPELMANLVRNEGTPTKMRKAQRDIMDTFEGRTNYYLYNTMETSEEFLAEYKERKGYGDYGKRRNALNLHSWLHRKTLEFRHHHGSLDAADLVGWASMLATIVDYNQATPEGLVDALPRNPVKALLAVVEGAPDSSLGEFIEKRLATHAPKWQDELKEHRVRNELQDKLLKADPVITYDILSAHIRSVKWIDGCPYHKVPWGNTFVYFDSEIHGNDHRNHIPDSPCGCRKWPHLSDVVTLGNRAIHANLIDIKSSLLVPDVTILAELQAPLAYTTNTTIESEIIIPDESPMVSIDLVETTTENEEG
jgi:hypothetical protein